MKRKMEREGEQKINNQGLLMKIDKYYRYEDVWVIFEDGNIVHTTYGHFKDGSVHNPNYKISNIRNQISKKKRLGNVNINNQGYKMEIVEYEDANHLKVQFDDEYAAVVSASWKSFINGEIKNPYHPSQYGLGIIGEKYSTVDSQGNKTKEYQTWLGMLRRIFESNEKQDPSYIDCEICDEWLLFSNFYDWIHSQPNYEKWKNTKYWAIDKDIIKKGNKIYGPEFCCLVPPYVNSLFIKDEARRGDCVIGVTISRRGLYMAQCGDPVTGKNKHLGEYSKEIDAFNAYKKYKENCIRQIAKREFSVGNISQACYDSMMKYEVEITD